MPGIQLSRVRTIPDDLCFFIGDLKFFPPYSDNTITEDVNSFTKEGKTMKKTFVVTLVICLAFAAVGFADPSPDELAPVTTISLTVDEQATQKMPAAKAEIPTLTSEEEIPQWHPGPIVQKSM